MPPYLFTDAATANHSTSVSRQENTVARNRAVFPGKGGQSRRTFFGNSATRRCKRKMNQHKELLKQCKETKDGSGRTRYILRG